MLEQQMTEEKDTIRRISFGQQRAFGRGLWAPDDPVRWWHRLLGRKDEP